MAWDSVTRKTISNCWNKVKYLPQRCQIVLTTTEEKQIEFDPISELKTMLVKDFEGCDVDSYIDFDSNEPIDEESDSLRVDSLEYCINLAIEELGYNEKKEKEDEDDEVEIPAITTTQATQHCDQLIRFFRQFDHFEKEIKNIESIKVRVLEGKQQLSKQQDIMNYFFNFNKNI